MDGGVRGGGLAGGAGEGGGAGGGVVGDVPAAFVDEVVVVEAEGDAVVDAGFAVVLPPEDVVDLEDPSPAVR